jgi:hypothetical protein
MSIPTLTTPLEPGAFSTTTTALARAAFIGEFAKEPFALQGLRGLAGEFRTRR